MIPLYCDTCGKQIGWTYDAGPRGMVFCDTCYEGEE